MTTTDIRVAFDRAAQKRRSSLFRRFLRHPGGYIPLAIFVLIVLVGIFAPLLAPMDPNFVDLSAAKAAPGRSICWAATPPGGTSSAASSTAPAPRSGARSSRS